MAYSYGGDPNASTTAWIRFLIGDTGPEYAGYGWVFTDEEVSAMFVNKGNVDLAGAELLFIWARRLVASPDFQIGRFHESSQGAAKVLNDKAMELLAKALAANAGAFAGGISVSDKAAREADSDRTQSTMQRGWMDHPG